MPDEIKQVADIIKKGKAVLFAGAGVRRGNLGSGLIIELQIKKNSF